MFDATTPIAIGARRPGLSRWDGVALLLLIALLVFLGDTSSRLLEPLAKLEQVPISLDPWALPGYAARTTLRMLAALVLSLVFTFTYATLAAKSRRAGILLVPLLDILQSVPILGFISVTVVFFMSLAPGRVLGAEFAAIFAIFTSQAWNMAFSFYQSLRTVPADLTEAARSLRMSPWMRFWRLEAPFAIPGLVWNMMMSMSGGWFFVVASEAISVGATTVTLPGIGSYIALAIEKRDLSAILWAIGAMAVVILIYDQLLFRPLVAWADRFRAEQQTGAEPPTSWVLTVLRRSRLVDAVTDGVRELYRRAARALKELPRPEIAPKAPLLAHNIPDGLWTAMLFLIGLYFSWRIVRYVGPAFHFAEVVHVTAMALLTLVRVMVLIALASLIWVPIGVWIGLRPSVARIMQPIAQFLAAFPANLFFPLAVYMIVTFNLNADVFLSPLMILGTQWYILFNVIAGASVMPSEFRDVGTNLGVKGWLWWRKVALPAVFPYYLTGAITASGGSFNASIVAEYVSWGDQKVVAHGIGAYIAEATAAGDFQKIVLGVAVMSFIVVLLNRFFWRPLYQRAERRFRLD